MNQFMSNSMYQTGMDSENLNKSRKLKNMNSSKIDNSLECIKENAA